MSKYLSNVKMSLFTLILTFMLIGMIAVKGVTKKVQVPAVEPELDLKTWYYVSGDPLDPENYQMTPFKDCDDFEEVICYLEAPADPSNAKQPYFDEQAISDIEDALADNFNPQHSIVKEMRSR